MLRPRVAKTCPPVDLQLVLRVAQTAMPMMLLRARLVVPRSRASGFFDNMMIWLMDL